MTPEEHRQRRGQLASKLSLPPLSLLAFSFFLPTIKTCDKVESMAELTAGEPLAIFTGGAPYWIALLLIVLTVIALVKRRVPLVCERIAIVVLGLAALVVLGFAVALSFTEETGPFEALAMVPIAVLPLHAFWRAMVRRGWARWARLLCVYSVLAGFYSIIFLGARIEGGPGEIGPGAWLYMGADAALLAIASWVLSSSIYADRHARAERA